VAEKEKMIEEEKAAKIAADKAAEKLMELQSI